MERVSGDRRVRGVIATLRETTCRLARATAYSHVLRVASLGLGYRETSDSSVSPEPGSKVL